MVEPGVAAMCMAHLPIGGSNAARLPARRAGILIQAEVRNGRMSPGLTLDGRCGILAVMKMELDKIMAEAMDLPTPLRAFLAAKLIESLDANGAADLSAEWKEEIRRRCREIDEGTVRLVDAEEAFARAYARLTS